MSELSKNYNPKTQSNNFYYTIPFALHTESVRKGEIHQRKLGPVGQIPYGLFFVVVFIEFVVA